MKKSVIVSLLIVSGSFAHAKTIGTGSIHSVSVSFQCSGNQLVNTYPGKMPSTMQFEDLTVSSGVGVGKRWGVIPSAMSSNNFFQALEIKDSSLFLTLYKTRKSPATTIKLGDLDPAVCSTANQYGEGTTIVQLDSKITYRNKGEGGLDCLVDKYLKNDTCLESLELTVDDGANKVILKD